MRNNEQAEMIAELIGGDIGAAVCAWVNEISEIRIRAGRQTRLRLLSGREIDCGSVSAQEFRKIMLRLMENSVYAREDEMREGYFTTIGGCRVGICGKWNQQSGMVNAGSACIRIAREIPGCAETLLQYLMRDDCRGMLILSQPGMGKTTLLRDLARLASDSGMNIAIADERREIAACLDGIPQLDVGSRTDVMDGSPKAHAIPMLIRSCAPDAVFADEIGSAEDASAISDAVRCGVKIVAAAHAEGIEDAKARKGTGSLIANGTFRYAVLLGKPPGTIISIEKLNGGDA